MKQLGVYLNFPGSCREALNFYKDALGGEIVSIQTFGEAPVNAKPEEADLVMHAEFRAEGIFFMASDSMEGFPSQPGTNVTLNINLTDAEEEQRVFNALAEGGRVNMPLQETFWGSNFGMLTDKYGINWMTNRELM